MKHGLVFINKPYTLMQFIYLYTQSDNYEYDVIIELVENSKLIEDLYEKCCTLNIFANVKISCNSFKKQSFYQKIVLFIRLSMLAATKSQHRFYRELLEKDNVNLKKYARIIVDNDFSFLTSSIINCCENNQEIIMLEDGTADYIEKYSYIPLKNVSRLEEWISLLLVKMSYANISWHYVKKDYLHLIKYSANPELLRYKEYKEIRKLFDFHGEEKEKYIKIIMQIYKLNDSDKPKEIVDAVIFTSPLAEDYPSEDTWFVNGCRWLQKELNSKKVLIKRHPRDTFAYSFPKLDTFEMFAQVPGELLVGELKDAEVIFLFPSTILLNVINMELNYKIMFFNSIKNDLYKKRFWEYCEILKIPRENIVRV